MIIIRLSGCWMASLRKLLSIKLATHMAAVLLPFSADAPHCVGRLFESHSCRQAVSAANIDIQPS